MSDTTKLPPFPDPPTERDLQPRQLDVLRRAAAGLQEREIAADLSISFHTVRNHLSRVRGILGARNTTHAVAIAMRRGIIP